MSSLAPAEGEYADYADLRIMPMLTAAANGQRLAALALSA